MITYVRSYGEHNLRHRSCIQVQPNLDATIIFLRSPFFDVETRGLYDKIWRRVEQYVIEKIKVIIDFLSALHRATL